MMDEPEDGGAGVGNVARGEPVPASATRLELPVPSLVLLVGVAGCGKSTFAQRHFRATEVVSSDHCRAMVSDDESDQSATADAFELLHLIVSLRMSRMRVTVVDSTNVRADARRPLLALARRHHLPAVAVVLDLPEELCQERNRSRTGRSVPADAITEHRRRLDESLGGLTREGFERIHVLRSADEIDAATISRAPLPVSRRGEHGPFDIVGDVHGCADELDELLDTLGYLQENGTRRHPDGRRAVFVGDLVDRGPGVVRVLRTVMSMVEAGTAFCVPGNHDDKLARSLRGRPVQIRHGLEQSLAELHAETEEFRASVASFIERLPSHLVLESGRLVVAHAGMPRRLQGRMSARVRDFALYGETTGEKDELGLPERVLWAADYHGPAHVVYGHTPVREPTWLNRTINIDTGCVFGGRLTALRWPERELISVPAHRSYATSARGVPAPELPAG